LFTTRITRDYDIEEPIICAGMGFVGMPPLAAAVSNAGAMGTLGTATMPADAVRELIRTTRTLTSRPFGVNFITQFTTETHIDVCIEERVPVVSFHWNDPPAAFIKRLRANGIKVWMQVGSLEMAHRAAEIGVDALIVQGSEAGGHNRSVATTMTLLPAIFSALAPLPMIAAGGIADGRGLVAALALGADAVWVGTRFLASNEAYAHEEYKRRVLEAAIDDTVLTTLFGVEWPGAQARVLRNRVANQWVGRESAIPAPVEPPELIGHTVLGGNRIPLPKFSALLPTPETTGDFDEMCMVMGESVGLIKDIKPAGEIVREMAEEAEWIIQERLAGLVEKHMPTSR
jgi:NAD(P)H-dependent flavin oxidoreductase YrpB (nitropropane dioxygenase family)